MPTFQKPNLEADVGGVGRDPYISIRQDGTTLGISRAARKKLGVEGGEYVSLALDRTRRPWIGILPAPTDQGEPQIRTDGEHGYCVNSTLLNRHLRHLVDSDKAEGETLRFHLSGETAEDPDTGATLHRLEVPEVG